MQSLTVIRGQTLWGAILTAALLAALIFAVVTGNSLHGRHYPLVESTKEVELEVTLAHLWFEEAISGDRNQDLTEVWDILDRAERAAKAMLPDDERLNLSLIPVLDPALRQEIEEVVIRVSEFREIAEERWAKREESGVGSAIDQRFDAVFRDFLQQARGVEAALNEAIEIDHQRLLFLQIILVAFSFLLATYIGILIIRYEKRRVQDLSNLADSRERMKMAITGANLGTWDWEVESGQVVFNERWATMLGFTLGEVEPHLSGWEKLVHPDELAEVMDVINAHLAGETPFFETEYRLRHKSGKWVWVLDKGTVLERGVDGRPLRVCGTHLDITERKQEETQAARLSRVVDDSLNEIYIFDTEDFRFVQANRGARENLGYAFEELGALTVLDLKPELSAETFSEMVEPLRTRARDKIQFSTVHRRKDGSMYPVEVHVSMYQDDPPLFCAIVLDITERKEAEAELEKNFSHLEDMVAERTTELRTMVNVMAGRENRMVELKTAVRKLRAQLEEAGMTPVADENMLEGRNMSGEG